MSITLKYATLVIITIQNKCEFLISNNINY